MQHLVDDFEKLFQLAEATFMQARCEVSNERQLYALLMYGNVLESMSGAVAMLRTGNHSPLRGLGRSMLEAYVEVQNLASHDYAEDGECEYLEQMRAGEVVVLLGMCDAYLEKNRGDTEWKKVQKALSERVTENKMQGRYRLSAKKRFAMAYVPDDWYWHLYLSLLGFSHTKLTDLRKSAVKTNDALSVRLFREWERLELMTWLEAMCTVATHGLGALGRMAVPGIEFGKVYHHYLEMRMHLETFGYGPAKVLEPAAAPG